MKRWMVWMGGLTLSVLCAQGGQTMNVQVKETVLRDKPSFLGATVANLRYGDQVSVSEEKAGWSRVGAGGAQGWVHTSALTKKTVKPLAGGGAVGTAASGDELALAGKGFSKEVESEFKAQNKEADFTDVDRMEKIVVSEQEMVHFLAEGQVVASGEGGAL